MNRMEFPFRSSPLLSVPYFEKRLVLSGNGLSIATNRLISEDLWDNANEHYSWQRSIPNGSTFSAIRDDYLRQPLIVRPSGMELSLSHKWVFSTSISVMCMLDSLFLQPLVMERRLRLRESKAIPLEPEKLIGSCDFRYRFSPYHHGLHEANWDNQSSFSYLWSKRSSLSQRLTAERAVDHLCTWPHHQRFQSLKNSRFFSS
jgi:hypothetical protein